MMRAIWLLLILHGILWQFSFSISSIRVAVVQYHSDSRYLPAHVRHFIANRSNIQTIKACAYACNAHDYCRTANYYSVDLICSLFEESKHVGKVISALSTTVIQIQLCPPGFSEETHICFGDPNRTPIPLQTAFNSMSLLYQLPLNPAMIFMTTQWMYVPLGSSSIINVYDMQTMNLITTLSQSCNIAYVDMTFFSNHSIQNIAIQCRSIVRFLFNGSPPPSSLVWFSTACFSETHLVGLMVNNDRLRVWSTKRIYLRDILGANFNLISTRSCLILDDIVYFSSNSAIQSVNVNGTGLNTFYSMTGYPDGITMDSTGPNLFVPCATCTTPGVVILSRNGTLLARINGTDILAVPKPSKYRYRLVLATETYLSVYEI